MLRCDTCQERLLDHLYGLLDSADSAAMAAHLAECAACQAVREQADHWHGLIARAAKSEFPGVTFAVPVEAVAPAAASEPPAPPRRTARDVWVRWAVAASLLLSVAALGGPALRDLVGYALYKPRVDRDAAALEQAKNEQDRIADNLRNVNARLAKQVADAKQKHDALVTQWVKTEQGMLATVNARPFDLNVTGPTTAIPGAPNEYTIFATNRTTRRFMSVAVEAQAKNAEGKILFSHKLSAADRQVLKLPASIWSQVPPGTNPTLRITATDPKSGARGSMTETLHLLEPVYTTLLTTDRPLYRPGETIFFRSLTLDRTRFRSPNRVMNLHFALLGPNRQPVPGLQLDGLAQPVSPKPGTRTLEPVLGPDGQPLRGIGTGAFTLPANAANGEYTLTVSETQSNGARPRSLAERKLLVHKYAPDKIQKKLTFDAKTYGPGDTVRATLEVRDQAKPLVGARVNCSVRVQFPNGMIQGYQATITPMQTDAAGRATIQFALPKADELREVTLTITVMTAAKVMETLTRTVPLATRRLSVEFFPEGGDLIAGVPNRVYFRVRTSHGQAADITGELTNGRRVIATLKTMTDADHPGVNQGLGIFEFVPELNQRYVVKLKKPLGLIAPTATPFAVVLGAAAAVPLTGYALPPVKASGVVLNIPDGVTTPGEKLRVKLWSVGAKRSVLIGAYIRGQPVTHQRATIEPGKPTDLVLNFGAVQLGGVTRVTVFEESDDAAGRVELKPVAERLVFRRSGESLKLSYAAQRADGQAPPKGVFAPGQRVKLTLRAADENGQPQPAILLTAVVSDSVLSMADDKTAHLLPTHFLLNGEVRHGDDLEYADYLLTDQPKAAATLDLLLGTQGWRRFAEQAPNQFRRRVPAGEADKLLVAMGARTGPVPGGWRTETRRVFDEYWPKYEAVVAKLDEAEADRRSGAATRDLQQDLNQAQGQYSVRLTNFGQALTDFDAFDKGAEARRLWLPVTLFFTFGVGLFLLLVSLARPRTSERRTLRRGAIGFFALGLFVAFVAIVAAMSNTRWRAWVPFIPQQNRGWPGNVWVAPPPTPPATIEAPLDVEAGNAAVPPKPANAEKVTPAAGVGAMRRGPMMKSMVAPHIAQARAPVGRVPPNRIEQMKHRLAAGAVVERHPANTNIGPQPNEAFRRPLGLDQRLLFDLQTARERLDPNAPDRPQVDQALTTILQDMPRTPPLVVRQYAHVRAKGSQPDFTETLLWNPVLVLPRDGQATVTFELSDAVNGYQILVAGHTLDGRIGGITGMIEVRKQNE